MAYSEKINKLHETLFRNQEEQEKILKKTVEFIKDMKRLGVETDINSVSAYIGKEFPGFTRDETITLAQMAYTRYRTLLSAARKEKVEKLYEAIQHGFGVYYNGSLQTTFSKEEDAKAYIKKQLADPNADPKKFAILPIEAGKESAKKDYKVFDTSNEQGNKDAEKHQQLLYKKYDTVKVEPAGLNKVAVWGESLKEAIIKVGHNTELTKNVRDELMKAGISAVIEDMAQGTIKFNDKDKDKAIPVLKKLGIVATIPMKKESRSDDEMLSVEIVDEFRISAEKGEYDWGSPGDLKSFMDEEYRTASPQAKRMAMDFMLKSESLQASKPELTKRIEKLHESLKEQKAESYTIKKVGDKFMINQDGEFLIGYTFESPEQAEEYAKKHLKEQTLVVKRVPYGKDNVPEKDREYGIGGMSPVGTITEWQDFAKSKGYDSIEVVEKDGKKKTVKVEALEEQKLPKSLAIGGMAADVTESAKWKLMHTHKGQDPMKVVVETVEEFVKKGFLPPENKNEVVAEAKKLMANQIKLYGNPPESVQESITPDKLQEDLVSDVMAWEAGEMTPEEELKFFSQLIKSGKAWTLQGMYGRQAKALIDAGYLDRSGKILKQPESIQESFKEDFEVPYRPKPVRYDEVPAKDKDESELPKVIQMAQELYDTIHDDYYVPMTQRYLEVQKMPLAKKLLAAAPRNGDYREVRMQMDFLNQVIEKAKQGKQLITVDGMRIKQQGLDSNFRGFLDFMERESYKPKLEKLCESYLGSAVLEKAYEMGKKAFAKGETRVPKQNRELMKYIDEIKAAVKHGELSDADSMGIFTGILQQWLKGWDEANIKAPAEESFKEQGLGKGWKKVKDEPTQVMWFRDDGKTHITARELDDGGWTVSISVPSGFMRSYDAKDRDQAIRMGAAETHKYELRERIEKLHEGIKNAKAS